MTGVRALSLLAALAALAGPPPGPAAAGPRVEVRARTELRLRPIRRQPDRGYVVAGQLVDRATGQGVPDQPVVIAIDGVDVELRTDEFGEFDHALWPDDRTPDISVTFAGGGPLDAAVVRLADVDAARAAVELAITATPSGGGLAVTVTALADGVPVQVPVELRVGPPEAPGDALRPAATTRSGDAPVLLARPVLGGPGPRRVAARFAGDPDRSPAQAEVVTEVATATRVSLEVRPLAPAFEDRVTLAGAAVDDAGAAVPATTVAILADGRRVTQVRPGADGRYRVTLDASALGAGRHAVTAAAESAQRWVRTSASPVVVVEVAAPRPLPLAWSLAALGATVLAALGFFAARHRPWARLRRQSRAAAPAAAAPEAESQAEPAAGLQPARATLTSALRRPADRGIAGTVRDAVRRRALAGARVTLTRPGEQRATTAGADGSFAVDDLAPGAWTLEVRCEGHVTERAEVTLPHRGELRGAHVDLLPVRERIFTLYRDAALPALPDPARWGVWSPRQLLDHVRAQHPAGELARLTDHVEEAYFGPRAPQEDELPETAARVEAAVRERAGFAV